MTGKLKTAILGATGYSGFELARILLRHPQVETPMMLQRSGEASATNLADMYPAISGNGGYPMQPLSWTELQRQEIELLFLATPHEVSRSLVPEAIARGMRVIDLSGAWRLREAQHRAVYGFHDANAVTAAELTEKAVYGLPELNGDRLPGAALVANPGCYATSVILAWLRLLAADMVDREKGIISDSKSGVSGAGKEATARTHFVSVADNLSAYSVFGHRHVGEILEQLKLSEESSFSLRICSDSAGNSFYNLCAPEAGDESIRNRVLFSGFLFRQTLGEGLRDSEASANPVFTSYQLL